MDRTWVVWCAVLAGLGSGCGGRAAPVPPRAQPAPSSACGEEPVRWRGPLGKGGAVAVRIVRGTIRAEAGADGEVQIEGRARCPCACAQDERAVRVRAEPDARGVRFDARSGEVDVVVRLPEGARLSMWAVNGAIRTDGLHDVHARVVNGTIELAHAARADVHAVNGGIHAAFDTAAEVLLATVNGNVEAIVPENADLEVQAHAVNGHVSLGVPTTGDRQGGRSVQATVGRGGPVLRLKTVSGQIRVQPRG